MNICDFRQTCRRRVKINGVEHDVWILMSHQRAEGLNDCPVGNRVHLIPLGWFDSSEVEIISSLPWVEYTQEDIANTPQH